ncbi:Bifunctional protein aas [Budvicia aquatica]|uniref:Bifunctional protein aas n=1 Tax=Budvicia aquatica TaxID=82979 RepID=A0A485A0F3_9GAMM|nr:Bifunctional protein aas [Budvicia aquatica]
MDGRMATRKSKTLYEAFLDAKSCYGGGQTIIADIAMKNDTYRTLLKKSLGLSRIIGKVSEQGEHVGLLLPNTIVTAAAIFGTSLSGRIPAMLNYTAGVNGLSSALKAAEIKTIITSRQFLEKGQLTYLAEQVTNAKWYYLEDMKDMLTQGG